LVGYKGKFGGRQHIRGKPNDTGLKLYCFCDITGYCYNFWIYLGKDKTYRSAATSDIVTYFASQLAHLTHQQFCIIADSYFGSIQLAESLTNLGFFYCMCVKGTRFQSDMWQKLKQGLRKSTSRSIYNTENNMCMTAFHDRKLIGFISNFRGGASNDDKGRPEIASFYNHFMNGVDLFDQQLNDKFNNHKRQKWTQCWYYTLVKIVFTNCCTYYNNFNNSSLSINELLTQLLIVYLPTNVPRNITSHFPIKTKKSSRCQNCAQENKKSNTPFKCVACKIHLHPHCWIAYHSL